MASVSIRDVADRVGVSAATVSLVLNGKDKNGRVSEALAEKIRNEANAMNYKPNSLARALRSGRSETIGLIVADISNPFFAQLAFYIQEHAEKYNYSVIITNTNESTEKMEKMIAILNSRKVDGFLIVPTENGENLINKLVADKIPIVLLDRYFPEKNVSYVAVNNYKSSKEATNLLLNLHCKRIAHIYYKTSLLHMQARKDGYIAAMTKKNLFDPSLIKEVNYQTMYNDIQKAILELVSHEQKIDGIFFASNTISIMGLNVLKDMHIEVPKDIKVVCFDKSEAFELSNSSIPYIQQPVSEMGERAVDLLIRQINDKKAPLIFEELQANLMF
ncbi:MAG: LacI family transcriptional regulator [Tannerella sp.]|jgi:LacI family transcriptional regulator|nr:LacI family transcriptional regulator [Tannerella sp.]